MRGGTWLVALLLLLVGCQPSTPDSSAAAAEDVPRIVATTTIIGELTSRVVSEGTSVEVLMPAGTDPHAFEASAQQAESIREADLVVANGLGLEAGLEEVLATAEDEGANVLRIAPQVNPLPFSSGDHGVLDPHVWMDPVRMADAASLIGQALGEFDPQAPERAESAAEDLRALADELASMLDAVPPPRRTLVTNHDALGYFADRFEFDIVGTVIPAGSTLAEPSSRELAELADLLSDRNVSAVFAESTQPTRLSDALAAEVDDTVQVVQLYTGSLDEPGTNADTYEGMMVENVERIVAALT